MVVVRVAVVNRACVYLIRSIVVMVLVQESR